MKFADLIATHLHEAGVSGSARTIAVKRITEAVSAELTSAVSEYESDLEPRAAEAVQVVNDWVIGEIEEPYQELEERDDVD